MAPFRRAGGPPGPAGEEAHSRLLRMRGWARPFPADWTRPSPHHESNRRCRSDPGRGRAAEAPKWPRYVSPDAVQRRCSCDRPQRAAAGWLRRWQKLEAAGPRLGHPHSSAVRGEVGHGFRELRPRAGRSRCRPIYRRVNPSTFVIFAVAPEAEIDSRGYDAAVARAVERFKGLELD